MDGLFWPSGDGTNDSPAARLIDKAAFEKAKAGEGYFGYRFRVLTGQGPHVIGGRRSYVVNGNMTAGYALVAWPVRYRETGVQTFIIGDHGAVYQRDLGEKTEARAAAIKDFDPDDSWTVVNE
jgi:hypothetical protein